MHEDHPPRSGPGGFEADYTLLGEIGRGATGPVFLATAGESGGTVAVKIAPSVPGVAGAAWLVRAARRAQVVAGLTHPNLVHYRDVRVTCDDGLALVMDYVPGETLRDRLAADPRPPVPWVERVVRDVAAALAYAHAHGVVHRDVKPENIFLDGGRTLLSDFDIGVAALVDEAPVAHDAVVGTPRYMAPEQIDGGPVDARTDVYALGLVGWELLAGERPWAGEPMDRVLFHQRTTPLPSLRAIRPDAPDGLVMAIEAATAKAAAERATAEELVTLLTQASARGALAWARELGRRARSGRGPTVPLADQAPNADRAAHEATVPLPRRPTAAPDAPPPR